MKRFLLSLLLLSSYFSVFAVDYYSQAGQTDPNALSSWNTLQGGGGAAPGSFTNVLDRFIIQDGHTMTTTGDWSVSNIVIQNGGILQGDHIIPLSGIFQIDDGGTYIHNNAGSVLQTAGMSIFSGTESFAVNSNFEIRNWEGWGSDGAPLPNSPAITWGNLIVAVPQGLGGLWNWEVADGATLTVGGNLEIKRATGSPSSLFELRITGSGVQTINVGGNLRVSGSTEPDISVAMKKTGFPTLDGYTTMQVNGGIGISYSRLDLGINTTYPNPIGLYELRFKGYLSVWRSSLFSTSTAPYLVANGSIPVSIGDPSPGPSVDCNFRINSGSTLNLQYYWGGARKKLVILGTLNLNGWGFGCNQLEVTGGTLNADTLNSYYGYRGFVGTGSCTVCTGNGSFDYANDTWCATSGVKGVANISATTVELNSGVASSFMNAGHPSINSPGDIFFTDADATITNSVVDIGYTVNPNSVFSIDENSYIAGGNAGFNGNGGLLRIGSIDGITATGNTSMGNVRVGGTKNYNNAGVNNFEYFGENPQFTGDGLPATISGILKINNTSDAGAGPNVTLSQPTTVADSVAFVQGKLLTTATNLLTIADNAKAPGSSDSYVVGPVRKIGDDDFNFPIGSGDIFSPVGITGVSGSNPSDIFTAEYIRSNPQTDISNAYTPGSNIDHISNAEYWNLVRDNGTAIKKVSLTVNEGSFWTDMNRVFVSRYNGTAWTNEGAEIISGPISSNGYQTGVIRSVNAISDFEYFTLATDIPAVTYNIFPATSSGVDQSAQPREVGVKFRVTQPGYITGIRFYKAVNNGGGHVGHLWSNTGTSLASVTFTGETDLGWQQALFSSPVAVSPGITYIASYFAFNGSHAITTNFFTSAVVNGPLRALASSEDGGNGVFKNSEVPTFPSTASSIKSNFWVDVVFSTADGGGGDNVPPHVTTTSPVHEATGVSVNTTVIANFSEAINPATVTTSTFELKNGSTVIPAIVSTAGGQITLMPSSPLAPGTLYTAVITGGSGGVKDQAGNALVNDYNWTFNTAIAGPVTYNIFSPTSSGVDQSAQPREVGVKFRVTQPGYITGIRFYKGINNVGTHIGHLWSNTGTSLASVTFTGETASGWQQALFSSPVAVSPGITYIASYFTPNGNHAITTNFFTSAVVNGPLRALASSEDGGNGVFKNSAAPTFPNNASSISSNFWVDVVFTTDASTKLITRTPTLPKDEETTVQKLNVKVSPNPSENFFKLIVNSDDKAPISVRISDVSGRVLEHYEKVTAGSLLQVGGSLRGGTYFAEVIQGDQRRVVKIIKVN